MNNAIFSRNTSHFIMVVCHVYTYIVSEILANSIIPRETQFHAFVFHITTVNNGTVRACSSQHGSLYQPIFSVLDIPISGKCQTSIQKASINTHVILFGGLPLHFFVGKTTGIRACDPSILTTARTKIIIGMRSRHRSKILIVVDVSVAHLSPAGTYF